MTQVRHKGTVGMQKLDERIHGFHGFRSSHVPPFAFFVSFRKLLPITTEALKNVSCQGARLRPSPSSSSVPGLLWVLTPFSRLGTWFYLSLVASQPMWCFLDHQSL